MPSRIAEAGHTKAFDYPVAEHWGESRNVQFRRQGPVKQVRGPGHNVSCGAPALVLHENMRNTCLNYLQVKPR